MSHLPIQNRADTLGMIASFLCIVHCVGTFALPLLLPAFGLSIFAHEGVHLLLAFLVLGAGLVAFIPGLALHKDTAVAILASAGLSSIALTQLLPVEELWEVGLTLIGAGLVGAAHYKNRSLCRERACARCLE